MQALIYWSQPQCKFVYTKPACRCKSPCSNVALLREASAALMIGGRKSQLVVAMMASSQESRARGDMVLPSRALQWIWSTVTQKHSCNIFSYFWREVFLNSKWASTFASMMAGYVYWMSCERAALPLVCSEHALKRVPRPQRGSASADFSVCSCSTV